MRLATLILLFASAAHGQFTVPQRGGVASGAAIVPSGFTHVVGSTTGCLNPTGTATKCIAAMHVNPGAGHARLLPVTWLDSGALTVTILSSNGDVWQSIAPGKVAGAGGLAGVSGQMFRVFSSAGGADTLTVTVSSATTGLVAFLYDEYSYTGTISGFDGTPVLSNITGSANVVTSSSVTTSNPSDLLWASCVSINTTCSVGAGWTVRNDTNSVQCTNALCSTTTTGNNYATSTGQINEDKTGVSAGTYTATFGTPDAADLAILGLVAL